MIVGFENGTLQSRSFETVYNSRDVKGSIVDIECERDDLYVLEDGASILVFDLDHYSHSVNQAGAYASFGLALVGLVLVTHYGFTRRAKSDKEEETVETGSSKMIELQERLVDRH